MVNIRGQVTNVEIAYINYTGMQDMGCKLLITPNFLYVDNKKSVNRAFMTIKETSGVCLLSL